MAKSNGLLNRRAVKKFIAAEIEKQRPAFPKWRGSYRILNQSIDNAETKLRCLIRGAVKSCPSRVTVILEFVGMPPADRRGR